MKSLYIFTMDTRGSIYGIGTYIDQLLLCVKDANIKATVVELNSSCKEFKVSIKNEVRFIFIPRPDIFSSKTNFKNFINTIQHYSIYLLKDYIKNSDDNIFHLNRMEFLPLAKKLKENFSGKIILTMHYTTWSLSLWGNKKKLQEILNTPFDKLSAIDREIYNEVKDGGELINNYCDKVIAISQHTCNDILNVYKAIPNKVVFINNALKDTYHVIHEKQKQKIKEEYGICKNDKILIFAGRLDEIKGINLLTQAFGIILKEYPTCRLIIAGSGLYDNILALSHKFSSKIIFTGFISRKILYKLYSIADIGIVPSIHEEFGFVAIEMMMHKLPIIVSDTTGLAEIVNDHITGLKFKITKRSNNLNIKIKELLSNTTLCYQYGNAGRKRFKTLYDFPMFRKRMLEIYEVD